MFDKLAAGCSIPAYREAFIKFFFPRATVRCAGKPGFRSQLARDLGCLLDVDDEVVGWSCLAHGPEVDGRIHVVDFAVDYHDGRRVLVDAIEEDADPDVAEAASRAGTGHRFISRSEIESGFRLQNAKDLLRYAHCRTSLNDRIRLLAALDEAGSLSVADVLHLFREVQPLTGISWMILHRFIQVDLDGAMLGPETIIRRFQR